MMREWEGGGRVEEEEPKALGVMDLGSCIS